MPFQPEVESLGECRFVSPIGREVGDRIVLPGPGPDAPGIDFERAGPRRGIFFDPAQTRAAIAT
jgi:hypothetical protein